ncbi:ABC transporter substrate-binding protein [Vibrio sp. SS-MA-C1-2]|uniref:heme/hemin ABC transporter substrate-binding protein n=1 Tax=Vibrio sp. SS-MA-C1-2 TaxID=2908646 RepID=UPI001F2D6BFA|nr:ABC transporter substrate-binding protein [Vibrio sp. SS-MA-C1-2]UJF17332.1 ABC transporter substrate-binding protein [Vibrio sp. SS-MA-C1-2]
MKYKLNKEFGYTKALMTLIMSSVMLSAASVAEQPLRIISAGSNVTELIYALDAQDKLVAVDVTSRHFIEPTQEPDPASKTTEIAQLGYHRQLSAEGMMALNPSHLIGSKEMGPETTLSLLKASDVDVMIVSDGSSIEAFEQRIDLIAELTETETKANIIKHQAEQDIAELERKSAQFEQQPNTIFLMINKDRPATAAGTDTPIDRIIELSGGRNSANETIHAYKPLSYEAIINLQPDYILISERVWQQYENSQQLLTDFPLLKATPAGNNGQIIPIPSRAIIGGFGLESIKLAQSLQQRYLGDKVAIENDQESQ